jgi:hypothetical protein
MLDFKKTYVDSMAELTRLQTKKANLEADLADTDNEIEATTQIANAAASVIGEPPVPTLTSDWWINADAETLQAAGISIAVKAVIDSETDASFTAPMVRDALAKRGWDWGKYVNPLSTLHTVLKRLAEGGAINRTGDGRYRSSRERYGLKRGLLGVRLIDPEPPTLARVSTRISPKDAASLPMPKTAAPTSLFGLTGNLPEEKK